MRCLAGLFLCLGSGEWIINDYFVPFVPGAQGAVFSKSVETPHVRAEPFKELRWVIAGRKSPACRLFIPTNVSRRCDEVTPEVRWSVSALMSGVRRVARLRTGWHAMRRPLSRIRGQLLAVLKKVRRRTGRAPLIAPKVRCMHACFWIKVDWRVGAGWY